MPVKLIHCSDLHLDSPMESNLPPDQARQRGNEICSTFSRMVAFAREQGVEAILIAGDLFDSERVSRTTASFFLDTVAQADTIDFFYLRGNHDESLRAFSGRTLPENLHTFSEDWRSYPCGPVTITGLELDRQNCLSCYDRLRLPEDTINIVLLHGQDAPQPGEGLVCLPALRGRQIRYLALGHLHSYRKAPLDEAGDLCYCGCLEGRGFDECGEKGFVLLETGPDRIGSTFVPFAARTLFDLPVDISGLTTVTEILHAMEQAADGIDSRHLVKFTLCGSYTPETQKDLGFLRQMLGHRFFFSKIKDQSRLFIEPGSYEHDISLKGEFVRLVLASGLSDTDKDAVICCGIRALSGEEVVL